MASEKFIIKMQASIVSNDVQSVLIYNEDESIMAEYEANDEFLRLLDGRPKAFFFATLDDKGGLLIGDAAPWQQW